MKILKRREFGDNFIIKGFLGEEEYIKTRLIWKIKLYFKKSKLYKNAYRFLLLLSLIAGALIPIVTNWSLLKDYELNTQFGVYEYSDLIVTILSILLIVVVSLELTFNFREKFKNFKKAEDELTSELYLYQTSAEPYMLADLDEKFRLLVNRVESIIAKERLTTIVQISKNPVEKK